MNNNYSEPTTWSCWTTCNRIGRYLGGFQLCSVLAWPRLKDIIESSLLHRLSHMVAERVHDSIIPMLSTVFIKSHTKSNRGVPANCSSCYLSVPHPPTFFVPRLAGHDAVPSCVRMSTIKKRVPSQCLLSRPSHDFTANPDGSTSYCYTFTAENRDGSVIRTFNIKLTACIPLGTTCITLMSSSRSNCLQIRRSCRGTCTGTRRRRRR